MAMECETGNSVSVVMKHVTHRKDNMHIALQVCNVLKSTPSTPNFSIIVMK